MAFISILLFLGIISYFGFSVSRKLFQECQAYLIIPLSICLGLVFYIMFLNILSYLIPFRFSVYVSLLLMLMVAVLLRPFSLQNNKLVLGFPRRITFLVVSTALMIALWIGYIAYHSYFFDAYYHFNLTYTIAYGNFPVMNPFAPSFYYQYHYGINLLMAGLHLITGISVPRTPDLLLPVIAFAVFLMVFAIVMTFSKNWKAAFLAALLFFYGAGFRYLDIFSLKIDNLNLLVDPYFVNFHNLTHGLITDTFAVAIFNHPGALATLIYLGVVYLFVKNMRNRQLIHDFIIAILLGALALVREDYFLLLALSFSILLLIEICRKFPNPRKLIFHTLFIFLLAGCIVLFQGGVLTDLLLHGKQTLPFLGMAGKFGFKKQIGFPVYYDGFIPLGSPGWFWQVLKEFGFPLLFFPLTVFFCFWKRSRFGILFSIISIIGFLIPITVSYGNKDWELVRFFQLSTMGLLLGYFLGEVILSAKASLKKYIIIFASLIVILGAISPLWFSLVAWKHPIYKINGWTKELDDTYRQLFLD